MGLGECSHRGSRPDTGTRYKGAGRSARTNAPEPEPESARTNAPGPESARTDGPEPRPLELPGLWRHRRARDGARNGARDGARDTAAGPLALPDGSLAPGSDLQIAHRQHLRAGGSSSLVASPAQHVLHRGMGPALRASDERRWRLEGHRRLASFRVDQ